MSDKKLLKKVIAWSEISIKLDKNAMYYDTLANLHFKAGNKDKAIATQEEAIKMLKAVGLPTFDYEKTLKKFKE